MHGAKAVVVDDFRRVAAAGMRLFVGEQGVVEVDGGGQAIGGGGADDGAGSGWIEQGIN